MLFVQSLYLIRCIPKILDEFLSKNKDVRAKMMEYVKNMLIHFPPIVFEKYMDQLTKVAIHSLEDTNPCVRSISREVFFKIEELFPTVSENIRKQMSKVSQKYIEDEKAGQTPPKQCKTPNPGRLQEGKARPITEQTNDDNIATYSNTAGKESLHEENVSHLEVETRKTHSKSQKSRLNSDIDIDILMGDLNSKIWSRRVEAIEAITSFLKNSHIENELFNKIINALISKLSDNNSNVK